MRFTKDPEITGDSPQAVAYALPCDINEIEHPTTASKATKEWILKTYLQCLKVVTLD